MIHLEGVRVSFGGNQALAGIDLHVARGEWLAVIGPSGSGKTTALRTINALVQPTSGRVRVNGTDVRKADPAVLRRQIGYVMQSVGLFPHWTVARNIGVVPTLCGWPPDRVAARVASLLELVRLPGFGARLPSSLSGGERQRVGLARALAAEPPVLLLDEAFGALDPMTRDVLVTEVRELHEQLALTTVMVTHDMMAALRAADRIAVMHKGQVVQIGTGRELWHAPAHPVVAALLEAPRRQAALLEALA